MGYKLGKNSLRELEGVHPDLVAVVKTAIRVTSVDFAVHDGIRTREQQAEYVRTGVSWTMDSKHLPQGSDGYGHAVDLVPYIGGRLRWEWEPLYKIADTMRSVAMGKRDVRILWGGHWEELTDTWSTPEQLMEEYVARRKAQGRKATPDGPHFEIILGEV